MRSFAELHVDLVFTFARYFHTFNLKDCRPDNNEDATAEFDLAAGSGEARVRSTSPDIGEGYPCVSIKCIDQENSAQQDAATVTGPGPAGKSTATCQAPAGTGTATGPALDTPVLDTGTATDRALVGTGTATGRALAAMAIATGRAPDAAAATGRATADTAIATGRAPAGTATATVWKLVHTAITTRRSPAGTATATVWKLEVGDYGILLGAGFKPLEALAFNFLSALVALAGTVLALYLGGDGGGSSMVEGFTAGGFIYIAAAGVIPEMQQEGLGSTLGQGRQCACLFMQVADALAEQMLQVVGALAEQMLLVPAVIPSPPCLLTNAVHIFVTMFHDACQPLTTTTTRACRI
eukprot:gene5509-6674_t